MDYFPMESPGSAVVSKCNVFPISGQNICGYLHHTQDRNGKKHQWQLFLRGSRGWQWRRGTPTVLGLPANIFPFFSRTSLACVCWLTMITQWEPIIREYVCPYFCCSSLKSTWGGCGLRRLSRLPMKGSAGREGGSWGPSADILSFNCSTNKARPTAKTTHRHRNQAISVAEGPDRGVWFSRRQASPRGAAQGGHEQLHGHAFMQLLQCQILESEQLRLGQFKQDKMTLASLNSWREPWRNISTTLWTCCQWWWKVHKCVEVQYLGICTLLK